MIATASHLQLMLVTEGIFTDYAIIPVLIPSALGVGTHLTGCGIDKLVPSVVLEGVVLLTTQTAAQTITGNSLGISPAISIVNSLVAQCLIHELNILLLINVVVALGGTR